MAEKSFSDIYDKGIRTLGDLKLDQFTKAPMECLLYESNRKCLLEVYNTMKKKDFEEIEKAPEKVKRESWEQAKKLDPKASKEKQIELAKAIYTLNQLAAKKLGEENV